MYVKYSANNILYTHILYRLMCSQWYMVYTYTYHFTYISELIHQNRYSNYRRWLWKYEEYNISVIFRKMCYKVKQKCEEAYYLFPNVILPDTFYVALSVLYTVYTLFDTVWSNHNGNIIINRFSLNLQRMVHFSAPSFLHTSLFLTSAPVAFLSVFSSRLSLLCPNIKYICQFHQKLLSSLLKI